MPKNLELKAKIKSLENAVQNAQVIGAVFADTLYQRDTYFNVQHGRLKLREIKYRCSELIFYQRVEQSSQRISNFEIVPCEFPEHLRNILTSACTMLVTVQKKRVLYMMNATRIHIDDVEELGSFIEFEVPFSHSEEDARVILDRLMQQFAIEQHSIIFESYSDLLLRKQGVIHENKQH